MSPRCFKILLCVSFLLLFMGFVRADDLSGRLESHLKAWHEAGQINGSVLVAEGDEIILAKGYGLANIAWDVPNSPETRSDIGSISKQFTTVLVFQLCADNKIRLDGTVLEYLPEYREDTGLIQNRRINRRMAIGHQRIGQHYGLCAYEYIANLYGAGGMYSTVIDLFKWNRAIRAGSLLSPEWQEKMFATYMKEGINSYAYSQTLLEVRLPNFDKPVKFYSFNGATTGFISDALFYPETGHTIVLLDNSEEYNHWQIAPGLYSILMGG